MRALRSDPVGQGEPVLLIHGLGHRHPVCDPLTALLVAEGFHVIAVDPTGHGLSSSSWRPSSYSIDATIERIIQTLNELGVEDLQVVGNSLGGLVALESAAQRHAPSVTALAPAESFPRCTCSKPECRS